MIEDEDVYKIVSSLLDSNSDSEEYDVTEKVCELERQVAILRTENSRLKDLVLDIKKNPSKYEDKDASKLFAEIENNATEVPSHPEAAQKSRELVLSFNTDVLPLYPPMSILSLDTSEPKEGDEREGEKESDTVRNKLEPGIVNLTITNIPPDLKKDQVIQQKKRVKSFGSNNLFNNASLFDYKGCLVNLSKYQPGCRFIQKQLDTAKNKDEEAKLLKMVLDEIAPSLTEVLTDTYGQYLIPNVVAHCDTSQRISIIEVITPNIYELSCNTYGSHSLQKVLGHLDDAEAELFGKALDQHVLSLSKDPKGNYILQTYLKTFGPGPRIQFIIDRLCEHISEVSMNKVGCTVMCKCIENGNEEQQRQIVDLVANNVYEFVQDQFANYVVQDVLNVCGKPLASIIVRRLYGKVTPLCFQKFSSNVVEKCLETSTGRPEFEQLYAEIMGSEKMLRKMLQDPYGNFVVQKLLDTSNSEQHARLTEAINPLIKDLKTSQYAIHIHKKLNKQN